METDGGGRTRADNHGRGQAEVSPIRWAQLAKLLLANVRLCPYIAARGDVGSGVGPMDTMTIERLTGKQIKNAKIGHHADGGGLYLQKREGGLGSWIFRYARNGKETWLGLGSLDTINVVEAREQARQMRQMLLAGKDPAIERRERRAEQAKQQAATILFRDAWAEVVAARKGEWKNEDSLRQWESSLASIDRALGRVPCQLIDATMIRSALEAEWKRTQVTADRTRQRIEAVLDWAAVHTGRTGAPNPARWKGNLQHVLRDTAEVKHHEALPYEQ